MKFISKAALYGEIDRIRAENGVLGPLDPYALARRHGIKISVYEFDSRRLSGVLMRGKRRAEIVVNSSRCAEARRFAVAHELVHYFLHDGTEFMCLEDSGVTALEWQANEGAAELLLPYRDFLSFYKNIRSLYIADEDRAVRALAKEFSVTPGMVKTRLLSLSPEIAQLEAGMPIENIHPLPRRAAAPRKKPSIDVLCEG